MTVTEIKIRLATPEDASTIVSFIQALAEYEREPDAVEATPESIAQQLSSDPPPFECLLAEVGPEVQGFALFFHNYSTWRGKAGIYLEDLFVPESHRGHLVTAQSKASEVSEASGPAKLVRIQFQQETK